MRANRCLQCSPSYTVSCTSPVWNFCKLYCSPIEVLRGKLQNCAINHMSYTLKVILNLLGFLILAKTSYGQEDCHCPSVVYLQFGGRGKIPCRCDHFSLVSWYSSEEDYDDGGIPFITYDNSETIGSGKVSGQFDLELDGSLIISNVSMIYHEVEYFCVFLRYTQGQTVKNKVKVKVIVLPDPLYPVLNGHKNHQYLYLDMKRQGTLNCSMEGVHPEVNLSITDQGQQGGFFLERGDISYSPNEDNTYDVKVTYNYTADLWVQTSILQCKVTGELSKLFSLVTIAEISFPPSDKAFPVVYGGVNPEHIYLVVNRTGEMECSIRSSDPETSLVWRVIDPFSEDKIIFDNCILKVLPRDDTFLVHKKCSYVVKDEDVDRLTVQCQVAGSTAEQYQNAAKVELLFPKKAQSLPAPTSLTPVIDGCNSKHDICTLKLQSEGELTCRVENIHQSVELRWNIFDGQQWLVSSGKVEVARDVMSTFQYEAKKSQVIMIAECYTVIGDKSSEASSKVVLVTERDGELDNNFCHGILVGLILLIVFLVIIFGLIVIILWYCNRKMYKASVMKYQHSTPLRFKPNCEDELRNSVAKCLSHVPPSGRPGFPYSDGEDPKQGNTEDFSDSGTQSNAIVTRSESGASEMSALMRMREIQPSSSQQDGQNIPENRRTRNDVVMPQMPLYGIHAFNLPPLEDFDNGGSCLNETHSESWLYEVLFH